MAYCIRLRRRGLTVVGSNPTAVKFCYVIFSLYFSISIKKRNSLWFSCISDLHFVTFAA